MEPSSKRRKLAPKTASLATQQQSQPAQPYAADKTPAHDPTVAVPGRHDFESFARHLQDAAMLIYRQTRKSLYTSASVLLLRWEEDISSEPDLNSLEDIFRERYHYQTDKWYIPTVSNPSIKLGVRMASFLEHARPDHLLIIYYAGHGYLGPDNHLHWASNSRDDAAKLKWDGVRCLFEDAQSDILLLLDSCAAPSAPVAGSHGLKQMIAAHGLEQGPAELGPSFTASLVGALNRLSDGRPFSAERLYEEVLSLQQLDMSLSRLANPTSISNPGHKVPIFVPLTPGEGRRLTLSPLPPETTQTQPAPSPGGADGQTAGHETEDQLIDPAAVVDLTFDEARVLVCTTFVGDASPDMSYFNQWLHDTPPAASRITVEGMFLGPPTMLLISMPHSVWNVVQHDKVCCFLGTITSHNMTHLYKRLVGTTSVGTLTGKEVEDGRILLEAREVATNSPSTKRYQPSSHCPTVQPDPASSQAKDDGEPFPGVQSLDSSVLQHSRHNLPDASCSKNEVEDSAEVQEAAEQLKALSHVRHNNSEKPAKIERHDACAEDGIEVRPHEEPISPWDGHDSVVGQYAAPHDALASKAKHSKPSIKQTPRQETRCAMCSHAPFKDSSSLRKHIAAAHTRPFPCAFCFAGCQSTFGSKNEWKRHIASQHLCLQYYRCSSCPLSTAEGKGNEFNRKDLFTQHLRRMHAPFAIKKALAKGDSKLQAEWELHMKEMQQSCLVTRRQPPQRSACPKPDCQTVFEGPGSWDEWTEHVGRHMEKGEAQRLGVDRLLAKWALDEGIIERKEDGEYRLCSGPGGSGDRDTNYNSSFTLDSGKRDFDENPSITVATLQPSSKMEMG